MAQAFCRVYVMPLEGVSLPIRFACEERNNALARVSAPALHRQKCATWYLLERALSHSIGLKPEQLCFFEDAYGKWQCDRAYFSLSHTARYAVAAVSDRPCGVDAEETAAFEKRYGPEKAEHLRRFITHPQDDPATPLLYLWTQKESIFKCYGKGSYSPRAIDTSRYAAATFRLQPEGLILSVCGEGLADLRFFRYEKEPTELSWPDLTRCR